MTLALTNGCDTVPYLAGELPFSRVLPGVRVAPPIGPGSVLRLPGLPGGVVRQSTVF
jgi:hypothetical protein